MTFPLKEELVQLEDMARRQVQIYNDAADFGLLLNKDTGEAVKGKVREICLKLKEFYGAKIVRYPTGRYGRGAAVAICIPVEQEGERYGCIAVNIDYNQDLRRKKEFFTIVVQSVALTPEEAVERYNSSVLATNLLARSF